MKFFPSVLFLLLTAAGVTSCKINSLHSTNKQSCCSQAQAESPGTFTDKSVYQIQTTWTTDGGNQIKLDKLGGRPQVVAMFFANCQFACPIIVNDMKRLESSLPPASRSRIGFTLVSFDSERDTPAALAEYRKTRALSAEQWTLLRGNPDDVLELSALLGVKFKADANGQFAHSNVITILNAQGEIVYQQVGLNQDIQKARQTLQQLVEK